MGKRAREKRSRRSTATSAAPEPSVRAPADGSLRCDATAAAVLIAVSLAVRALLLAQIARTPYFEIGNIDSTAYQRWATRIAAGEWWPAGTFYQSPLYAYFLAVLYRIVGPGPWSPRIVQVIAGSLSPALVYAIGSRLYSRSVGWLAGLGLALYGPIVLEEITFSKTSLLVVTALAGFALYVADGGRRRTATMAAAGVLFGITIVGVGQWLLPVAALVAWAPRMGDTPRRPDRRPDLAVAFAAGVLVVVLPLVAWNTAHGGGLVLTSGDAGLNFYNGNNERASGLPAPPPGVRDVPQFEEADARQLAERALGRSLAPAEVARYWSGRGLVWIAFHPGDWVVVVGRKLLTLWNAFEIPDNYEYAFMRKHFLPWLRPLVTFALVGPLALVGAVVAFRRRPDVVALYIACFGYMATMVIFYVRGRYRIPAVPFLLVFAAVALDGLGRALAARRWRPVATLAGGLALAAVVTNHEYCEAAHDGMMAVCLGGDTWFDQEWLKLAEWARNAGQLDRAIAWAERARECSQPRSPGQIATWIGDLHTMRAEELVAAGRRDDALSHSARAEGSFRTALARGYQVGLMQSRLGTLYSIVGKPADAVAAFEAATAAGRIDPAAARRFARAYVALGRCAEAERVLVRLDRDRGLADPSEETRATLSECRADK